MLSSVLRRSAALPRTMVRAPQVMSRRTLIILENHKVRRILHFRRAQRETESLSSTRLTRPRAVLAVTET